jgi:hypothetical protein
MVLLAAIALSSLAVSCQALKWSSSRGIIIDPEDSKSTNGKRADAQNSISTCQLAEGGITLESVNGDDTVTVKIRQVEFGGAPCVGRATKYDTAQHLFFEYTDPVSGALVCDYNTDADVSCFEETVIIACDATNRAFVELYIRDETYSPEEKVTSPNVGICLSNHPQLGKKSRSWAATYDCNPDSCVEPCGSCTDTEDCVEGHFCSPCGWSSMDPSTCQPYELVGGSCGGLSAPGFNPTCDPSSMYCREHPLTCTGIADAPGSCSLFDGTCCLDSDCDAATHYCGDGLCKELIVAGECCDDVAAPCAAGLLCTEIDLYDGMVANVCQ